MRRRQQALWCDAHRQELTDLDAVLFCGTGACAGSGGGGLFVVLGLVSCKLSCHCIGGSGGGARGKQKHSGSAA